MGEVFGENEPIVPLTKRASILATVPVSQLTAEKSGSDPNLYILKRKGQTGQLMLKASEGGQLGASAMMLDPENFDFQTIPPNQFALIPIEGPNFNVYLADPYDFEGFSFQFNTLTNAIKIGDRVIGLSSDNPFIIGVGRNRSNSPTSLFPVNIDAKYTKVSSTHLTMALIDVGGKPHVLIEDISRNGTKVRFVNPIQSIRK